MESHERAADDIELSREEIQAEADALASLVLHTSADEAWTRVRQGELEGTLFASKLARLYFLLGSYGIHHSVARKPAVSNQTNPSLSVMPRDRFGASVR